MKVHHWLFFCQYYACENGKEYYWSGGCLGFGSSYVYNIEKHFRNRLEENGTCSCSGIVYGGMTSSALTVTGLVAIAVSLSVLAHAQIVYYSDCKPLFDLLASTEKFSIILDCMPLYLVSTVMYAVGIAGAVLTAVGLHSKSQ